MDDSLWHPRLVDLRAKATEILPAAAASGMDSKEAEVLGWTNRMYENLDTTSSGISEPYDLASIASYHPSHDYETLRHHPNSNSDEYQYAYSSGYQNQALKSPSITFAGSNDSGYVTRATSDPSEYPCLYPNCGHISSRAHDLKRHMSVHFPPAVDKLLDCRYEWCGRIGANGFKREDHRKQHYRKVHMKESEHPKTKGKGREGNGKRRSSPPALSSPSEDPCSCPSCGRIHCRADHSKRPLAGENNEKVDPWEGEYPRIGKGVREGNGENALAAAREPTVREKIVHPSGKLQASGISTEAVARFGSLQPSRVHESPPEQESARSQSLVPDPDVVMSEALDANDAEDMETMATTSEGVEIQPSEPSQWGPCSDDDNLPKSLEDASFHDLQACGDCERSPPTTPPTFNGEETSRTSMSYYSLEDKPVLVKALVLETMLASEADPSWALLKVEWDILTFMRHQFRDDEDQKKLLGPVVTISGSAQHAQATTCAEYIQRHWPVHGSSVLDALQNALNSPLLVSYARLGAFIEDGSMSRDDSHAELEFDVAHDGVRLNVRNGNPDLIADLVQQLSWMAAALRTSVDGRVQCCNPKLGKLFNPRRGAPTLLISFDMTSPGEDDQSCWFPLFKNPVIAHGFPTAPRNNSEVGLEIPLDIMAALGGARHVVDFEGGLVLKGWSTLLVPMERHEDSVQWHLICARGEDRIPYREASVQCPNRALLEDLNHEELRTTRAFLGLWKEAETHLATADADYESIDWSKAKEAGPSPRLTGGTFGISKIISAQMNFVLGAKDGPFHYSQQEPFLKTVDRAEKLPVVLYDQADRRAWLVPALPVILHIIQLRNHIKPFVVGGKKVQISPLDPLKQGHAAREAIAKNKSQKLFERESNEDKDYYFRDAVLDTWSVLDRLMEREATTQATPGMAVHTSWQKTLQGWELRALADEDRHLKQKEQVLEKTAGPWYKLVKDVDAIVLFANGLGDIIKPRPGSAGLCQKWRRLPKGKDYLAVCVSMLEIFYAKAGHRQDHQYLTSAKLQWYRGPMLFEHCTDVASNCCKCDRVQQVYYNSYQMWGHRIPPGNLEANGCVVFGQAQHSFRRHKKTAVKQNAVHVLPDTPVQNVTRVGQNSTKDDFQLPSFPLPKPGKINGQAIQSLRRSSSPQNHARDCARGEVVALEQRPKMSHNHISRSDTYTARDRCNSETSLSENYALYQSVLEWDIDIERQKVASSQTPGASEADYAPVEALKTIRRRGKLADYGHVYGCSCATCLVVGFEPPGGVEMVSTSNGIRRNSTTTIERKERQPL